MNVVHVGDPVPIGSRSPRKWIPALTVDSLAGGSGSYAGSSAHVRDEREAL